jgi:aspartyl-tRNA(Asn)/glutamyl-tRNA(Gln) amidotransferase subunit A
LSFTITTRRDHDDDGRRSIFQTNRLLFRNPSIANMLDLCAVSMPCHSRAQAPVGLMLFGRHMADRRLLATALAVEALLETVR